MRPRVLDGASVALGIWAFTAGNLSSCEEMGVEVQHLQEVYCSKPAMASRFKYGFYLLFFSLF